MPNEISLDKVKNGSRISVKVRVQKKEDIINSINAKCDKDIDCLSKRDLMMFGIGLYLGEGAKTIESVRLINSDPKVIKLAILWFNHIFGVKKDNLTLHIHSYPDLNTDKLIAYWSDVTGIPKTQFGKTQIDTRINKHHGNKLPYGTVQLRVVSRGNSDFGVNLHRLIMGYINSVSEKSQKFDKI